MRRRLALRNMSMENRLMRLAYSMDSGLMGQSLGDSLFLERDEEGNLVLSDGNSSVNFEEWLVEAGLVDE